MSARPPPTLFDAEHWMPPYAYMPTTMTTVPALFAHPRYLPHLPFVQAPMDPPIAPEAVSDHTGIPLEQPSRTQNRYVREMVNDFHSIAPTRPMNADNAPPLGYNPLRRSDAYPIGIAVDNHVASPHLFHDIEQIHHIQQTNLRRLQEAKGKGRAKGKSPDNRFVRYEGLDSECSICLQALKRGEWVTGLTCNHLYHRECWQAFLNHDREDYECPNCRGPAITKSSFRYVGSNARDASNTSARHGSARRGDSSTSS